MFVKTAELPAPRTGGWVNNATASAAIWSFYHSNVDRVILTVFVFVKITVETLRPLFVLIAGPDTLKPSI